MSTSRVPTWEEVRNASDELDQMASQTVLKACDVGDMLRAIRLTMDSNKFYQECLTKLSKDRDTVSKLIVLSFRRSAVLEALANGQANDSIRSAYEHVKGLSAPSEEVSERDQWPKAKRGPKAGSSNAGRPKATTAQTPKAKRLGWSASVQADYRRLFGEQDLPVAYGRNNLTQQPETRAKVFAQAGGVAYKERMTLVPGSDESVRLAKAVRCLWLADNPEQAQVSEQAAESALSAVSKRPVADVKADLEKAIHARLLGEAQKAVAAAEEQIRAEYNEKLRQAWEEVDQKQAELNAAVKRLNNRMIGIRPLMTRNEWKGHVALCHRDQWPELKDDDVRIVRLNRLFHALQKMKDQIDPMTPIAELRATGWEDIAPAHKRNRRKSNG